MHRSIFWHSFRFWCIIELWEQGQTSNLDAEAYSFATAYANAKGIPLGAAVSELLRQRAEQAPETSVMASGRLRINARGLLVKAGTGRVITSEIVKESSEDDID